VQGGELNIRDRRHAVRVFRAKRGGVRLFHSRRIDPGVPGGLSYTLAVTGNRFGTVPAGYHTYVGTQAVLQHSSGDVSFVPFFLTTNFYEREFNITSDVASFAGQSSGGQSSIRIAGGGSINGINGTMRSDSLALSGTANGLGLGQVAELTGWFHGQTAQGVTAIWHHIDDSEAPDYSGLLAGTSVLSSFQVLLNRDGPRIWSAVAGARSRLNERMLFLESVVEGEGGQTSFGDPGNQMSKILLDLGLGVLDHELVFSAARNPNVLIGGGSIEMADHLRDVNFRGLRNGLAQVYMARPSSDGTQNHAIVVSGVPLKNIPTGWHRYIGENIQVHRASPWEARLGGFQLDVDFVANTFRFVGWATVDHLQGSGTFNRKTGLLASTRMRHFYERAKSQAVQASFYAYLYGNQGRAVAGIWRASGIRDHITGAILGSRLITDLTIRPGPRAGASGGAGIASGRYVRALSGLRLNVAVVAADASRIVASANAGGSSLFEGIGRLVQSDRRNGFDGWASKYKVGSSHLSTGGVRHSTMLWYDQTGTASLHHLIGGSINDRLLAVGPELTDKPRGSFGYDGIITYGDLGGNSGSVGVAPMTMTANFSDGTFVIDRIEHTRRHEAQGGEEAYSTTSSLSGGGQIIGDQGRLHARRLTWTVETEVGSSNRIEAVTVNEVAVLHGYFHGSGAKAVSGVWAAKSHAGGLLGSIVETPASGDGE